MTTSTSILPFESLLSQQTNGTYAADRGLDLDGFLLLVIHPKTYWEQKDDDPNVCLKKGDEVISRHPAVYAIISELAQEIVKGAPPLFPPIPRKNTVPRLKGLTYKHITHLRKVFSEKVSRAEKPLYLKDLRKGSPYRQVNGEEPWQISSSPQPSSSLSHFDDVEGISDVKEISAYEERERTVMRWYDICFASGIVAGIKYAIPWRPGLLGDSFTIVKDFFNLVIQNEKTSPEMKDLYQEIKRRGVRYPGLTIIELDKMTVVVIPSIINSRVQLNAFPV